MHDTIVIQFAFEIATNKPIFEPNVAVSDSTSTKGLYDEAYVTKHAISMHVDVQKSTVVNFEKVAVVTTFHRDDD